jgi:hypothetical protein
MTRRSMARHGSVRGARYSGDAVGRAVVVGAASCTRGA